MYCRQVVRVVVELLGLPLTIGRSVTPTDASGGPDRVKRNLNGIVVIIWGICDKYIAFRIFVAVRYFLFTYFFDLGTQT